MHLAVRSLAGVSNADSRKLLHFVLEQVAVPYIAMLTEWVFNGAIADPHGEFLVQENRDIKKETLAETFTDACVDLVRTISRLTRSSYWEQRFVLLPDQAILLFSDESLQESACTLALTARVINARVQRSSLRAST